MRTFRNLILKMQRVAGALAFLPVGSVLVTWNPSPDIDVKGYKIYYGNASAQYVEIVDVGKVTEYTVTNLAENTPYYFAVTAYDTAGNESDFSNEAFIQITPPGEGDPPPPPPEQNTVAQSFNFPNPFSPGEQTTQIRYYLPKTGEVSIEIFDLNNQKVRSILNSQRKAAGEHIEDAWDGRDDAGRVVANGVYFCKIKTEEFTHFVKIAIANR